MLDSQTHYKLVNPLETITFGKEDFPLLNMNEELMPGQQMLGEAELGSEAEPLMALCMAAGAMPLSGEFNGDELLYVEADNDAILQRVYSPAIWYFKPQSEEDTTPEQVVLRVGSNVFPVTIEKGELVCGSLKADGLDMKVVENNKKEKYLVAEANFVTEDGNFLYTIDVRIDGKKFETKTDADCKKLQTELKAALKKGAIADFLMVVGQGGEPTGKMEDLGTGEFLVECITKLNFMDSADNPRISYSLKLTDGRSVWAKGNVALILGDKKEGWKNSLLKRGVATLQDSNLPSERVMEILHLKTDVTLVIGKIEPKGQGYSVSCKLAERAPHALPMAAGMAELAPAQPMKQLAAAGAPQTDLF